ncbi:MAG: hypothetical protein ABIA75_00850 [Candidatus Neomarinimicrobiota bacterium]
MKEWLKKAFLVDSPTDMELSEQQKLVIDKVCREVVRRHMTTPALVFLESFRPLSYIGSQLMHFFQPIVSAVLTSGNYELFARFLEQRNSVDYLCRRIEFFETEYSTKEHQKTVVAETPIPQTTDSDQTDETKER